MKKIANVTEKMSKDFFKNFEADFCSWEFFGEVIGQVPVVDISRHHFEIAEAFDSFLRNKFENMDTGMDLDEVFLPNGHSFEKSKYIKGLISNGVYPKIVLSPNSPKLVPSKHGLGFRGTVLVTDGCGNNLKEMDAVIAPRPYVESKNVKRVNQIVRDMFDSVEQNAMGLNWSDVLPHVA